MSNSDRANDPTWPFEPDLADAKVDYQSKIFSNHPLFQYLGFEPATYAYGVARFGLPWREQLSNYGFELHGGMHATMVDTACGQAIFTALKRGFRLTTVHLDVRYFRPFTQGTMMAEGRVTKFGRTICHAETKLTVDDELIALGSTVYAIIAADRRNKA